MTNNKIMEDILTSDFLIINNKNENKLKNKNSDFNFFVLDLLETNKMLKQLIRLLQNLKQDKKNILYLLFENSYYSLLFDKLLLNDKEEYNIKIKLYEFNKYLYKTDYDENFSNLLLVLGQPYKASDFIMVKKFFMNKIFLINKINSEEEKFNYIIYKIFNDIKDLKKFIFIYIIIKQILKKINA
jgi:hypothetical protein